MLLSTILSIITVAVLFFIKVFLFYLFFKLFNKKTKFFLVLRVILIYETVIFFIVLLYPKIIIFLANLLNIQRAGNIAFLLFDFLSFCILLFLIFGFLMKKFSLLNWKKSIIVFIIVTFITPLIAFTIDFISRPIYNLPIFEQEVQKITKILEEKGPLSGPMEFKKRYPILSLTERIHSSLTGVTDYFREIIVLF